MSKVTLQQVDAVMSRSAETIVYSDAESGLRGVLVIETTRGTTAVGGTRFMPYPSVSAALVEMGEFARAVTYKSVLSGLPCGGAKGAILGDPTALKTDDLLRAFGRVVQRLGGLYTVTPDWGMSPSDLKVVATQCDYVTGVSGGTEPLVAAGVIEGIKGAHLFRTGSSSLNGLRVGIEGLGMAGPYLIEGLLKEGAIVIAGEANAALRAKYATQFPAVEFLDSVAALQAVELDAYCPCSGSGSLTQRFAENARIGIICGAANGQLATSSVEDSLTARDITYVPEFAANGGGVIYCYEEAVGYNADRANKAVASIRNTVIDILSRARAEQRSATALAIEIAEERL